MLLSPHNRYISKGIAMTHQRKIYCKRTGISSMPPAILRHIMNIRTCDWVLGHAGFNVCRRCPPKQRSCLKEPRWLSRIQGGIVSFSSLTSILSAMTYSQSASYAVDIGRVFHQAQKSREWRTFPAVLMNCYAPQGPHNSNYPACPFVSSRHSHDLSTLPS